MIKKINDIPKNLKVAVVDDSKKLKEQEYGSIFIVAIFGLLWFGLNYKVYKGKI